MELCRESDIVLFDFGINIDGTTTCDLGPCDANASDLSGVAGVDEDATALAIGGADHRRHSVDDLS